MRKNKGWMNNPRRDTDKVSADLRLMGQLEDKVRQYVPGPWRWTSWQSDDERDDVYGFVIGDGFASCTIEEATARLNDDAFIRELAAQILGFPVDSPQDVERRIQEAKQHIREINATIEQLEKQRDYWESYKATALRFQA